MGKIERARSCTDGIIFYSSEIPFLAVKGYISKNGKIRADPIFTPFEEFTISFDRKEMKSVNSIRFIVCLLLITAAILSLDGLLIFAAITFTFFVSKKLIFLLYQAYCMRSKIGSKRSVGRFHAAEHMAINAYNSLKKVPTLEEVKSFSKLSKHCGSMLMINDLVLNFNLCMLGLLYLRFGFILGILITIVTTILLVYGTKNNAFIFMQNLVLTNSTDYELSIAVKALETLELLENQFETYGIISYDNFDLHAIPISIKTLE